jgi:putative radical SAM enzyme (TIGR03279 family)
VDGNPEGLRPALYIRDDDYRLSFRYGNFATLTNLKPKDVARIIAYHLSPLYVSVHATDTTVRRWLLRNPEAAPIVPQLREFAAGGIAFHTQVVLVPGVNDGAVLERTLDDLYGLGAAALSVSVVPVALTEFSKHQLVRALTREECRSALDLVDRSAARAMAERGSPWCWGSDELYLRAERALPPAAWYGDFDQRENGVGAVRWLETRIAAARARLPDVTGQRIGIVTGAAMAPLFPSVVAGLSAAVGGRFEVIEVRNSLFGESVTTAGLLPGAAIVAALRGRTDLDLVLLPAEAVNDDGRFIDDLDAHDLAAAVPMPVMLSYDLADALVERGTRNAERETGEGGSAFRARRSALGEGQR